MKKGKQETQPRLEHRISETESVIWDTPDVPAELRKEFDKMIDETTEQNRKLLADHGFLVPEDVDPVVAEQWHLGKVN